MRNERPPLRTPPTAAPGLLRPTGRQRCRHALPPAPPRVTHRPESLSPTPPLRSPPALSTDTSASPDADVRAADVRADVSAMVDASVITDAVFLARVRLAQVVTGTVTETHPGQGRRALAFTFGVLPIRRTMTTAPPTSRARRQGAAWIDGRDPPIAAPPAVNHHVLPRPARPAGSQPGYSPYHLEQ